MTFQNAHSSPFMLREPDPDARVRLFCFPYAGGGATAFRAWKNRLPAAVDVCPIQLPGRENRLREPPFTRVDRLVEALDEALQPYLDVPFALFGYSLGALTAFEFARLLRRRGRAEPTHLFAAAAQAPHLPNPPPISDLPDSAFIEALTLRYDGMSPQVLSDAAMMELCLPSLRADFTLLDAYRHTPEEPLRCPITALGGMQDVVIGEHKLRAWAVHTQAAFRIRMFPGGHFFLNSDQGLLLRAIAFDLAEPHSPG